MPSKSWWKLVRHEPSLLSAYWNPGDIMLLCPSTKETGIWDSRKRTNAENLQQMRLAYVPNSLNDMLGSLPLCIVIADRSIVELRNIAKLLHVF
jgi:hypothetical protein